MSISFSPQGIYSAYNPYADKPVLSVRALSGKGDFSVPEVEMTSRGDVFSSTSKTKKAIAHITSDGTLYQLNWKKKFEPTIKILPNGTVLRFTKKGLIPVKRAFAPSIGQDGRFASSFNQHKINGNASFIQKQALAYYMANQEEAMMLPLMMMGIYPLMPGLSPFKVR